MFTNSAIATDTHKDIENYLSGLGLFFRSFFRVKDTRSLETKLGKKRYSKIGKKLQDAIGIRIVLYFPEDIDIVVYLLSKKFRIVEKTIDEPDDNEFCPTRCNLIFQLAERRASSFADNYAAYNGCVDSTYEVQIRTIFSEGWHEIEHDLRYKCKESWDGHRDLSRTLNGIYASLMASEWSIEKIFDDLSYRFYKDKNWDGMLKNKIRLRFDGDILNTSIVDSFSRFPLLAKNFFRIEKQTILKSVADHGLHFPMNLNNIIFFYNAINVHDDLISKLAPEALLDELEQHGIVS